LRSHRERGDPIFNAKFSVTDDGGFGLTPWVSQPGPLGGVDPKYFIESTKVFWDGSWRTWQPTSSDVRLDAFAPNAYPWSFYVRDGEIHEVWLSPS
jgi:hypothetical protein